MSVLVSPCLPPSSCHQHDILSHNLLLLIMLYIYPRLNETWLNWCVQNQECMLEYYLPPSKLPMLSFLFLCSCRVKHLNMTFHLFDFSFVFFRYDAGGETLFVEMYSLRLVATNNKTIVSTRLLHRVKSTFMLIFGKKLQVASVHTFWKILADVLSNSCKHKTSC